MQPTVKLRTEINVPKYFPKIKPETKANGDAKPNNNIQIIEKITKQKYEELLRRKEAAELSRRADVSSEELQFRIIEPPLVPSKPTGPKRLMFYTGVLVLGFGVGIALAFALSQLRPVLVRGRQLTALTSFPVLGAVTHLNLKQIQRRNRIRVFVFILSSGAIVSMYAILLAAELANVNLVERFL